MGARTKRAGKKPFANKKWYNPKVHSGWDKHMTTIGRRRKAIIAHKTYLAAGRSLQALSNVNSGKNGDKQTARLAGLDARYFFRKHEETKK
jgi:hypothetical protein